MKTIKLTEKDLRKIILKVINEQQNTQIKTIPQATSDYLGKGGEFERKNIKTVDLSPFQCVPRTFQYPVKELKEKKYNSYFLKAALGIIGRESDFGSSDRFTYLNPLKSLWAHLGGQTSVGYAQVKPETAENLGFSVSDLNTAIGALKAATAVVINNYERAKSIGYTNNPSNVTNGTGNAKLDMAIIGFNLGPSKIVKYCETNDPNKKRPCSDAGKVVDGLTVTNKFVPDYVPNYKTERWDGVSITTHGYVQEVANTIKKLSCLT